VTVTYQGASIAAAMTVAWVSGCLFGLWVGGGSWRRSGRSCGGSGQVPEDWRRSFNHENTNKPSGPPPLLFRRGERIYAFQPRGQGPRSNPNPPPRNP
jgi:hypothetical protein